MRTHRSLSRWISALMLAAVLAPGCGSGGGGAGAGGEGRSRETAVRILHGGIDAPAYALRIGEQVLQSARYLQSTAYSPVPGGSVELILELANLPGSTVFRLPLTLEDETEYSVVVLGESERGNLTAVVLPEPVQRPETGRALVQVVNAYTTDIRVVIAGRERLVRRGTSSGFVDTAATPQTLAFYDGGTKLGELTLPAADRSEATVLLSGSKDLGLFFTRVYADLD